MTLQAGKETQMLAHANRYSPTSEPRPGWMFVLPWSLRASGGVNQVVRALVQELGGRGDLVPHLLITSTTEVGDTQDAQNFGTVFMDLWGPIDKRHPVRAMLSFLGRMPARYRELRKLIRREKIVAINPHYPNLNALMFVALKKIGAFKGLIVLSFHGSDVAAVESTSGLDRGLWKLLLRNVDYVVAVSDSLGKAILKIEPRVASTLKTIYNGVDLDLFERSSDGRGDSSSRDSLHRPTIISVGAFVPAKGHDVLVQAFSVVKEQVTGARLVLVGRTGSELCNIQELIERLHLRQDVDILLDVPHEDVPRLLFNSDLFVLASRRESFGLVVVEAAAAMLPVVCTKAGGLAELITDGETGTLVDIDDSANMASAIVWTLRNPREATRMAANFYEYTKANLSWYTTSHQYISIWKKTPDKLSVSVAKQAAPVTDNS
jgi:glycosyltransferase involved in cell wall biosynthesis